MVSARLRTKKMMPWKLVEFMQHCKHEEDLWKGLVTCLREVSFLPSEQNSLEDIPVWTEVIEEGNIVLLK